MTKQQRLFVALSAYVAIAIVAVLAFPERQFRYPVIGLMVLLAFKSIFFRNETLQWNQKPAVRCGNPAPIAGA